MNQRGLLIDNEDVGAVGGALRKILNKAADLLEARGPEFVAPGICRVNGPTVQDEAQMPFGGMKAFGYGRVGGKWGRPSLRNCAGSPSRTVRSTIRSEVR